MQVPGTLVVTGDFNNAATISIARAKLSDFGVDELTSRDLNSTDAQERLLKGVTQQIRSQPQLYGFDIISKDFPDGPGVFKFFDMEFTVSLCRGEIIEGLGGRKRCGTACAFVDAEDCCLHAQAHELSCTTAQTPRHPLTSLGIW